MQKFLDDFKALTEKAVNLLYMCILCAKSKVPWLFYGCVGSTGFYDSVCNKNVISNDNIALKSSLMEVFILFKM